MKAVSSRCLFTIVASFLLCLSAGCGKSRLSDREVRREQIRLNAETKKHELLAIRGDYSGTMESLSVAAKKVSLHLDVVEAPFNDNGGIDPVMMPQLSGFLRIYSGSDAYDNWNIVSGEFDPKRNYLEVVVKDDRLGDMQLSLNSNQKGFVGGWQATALRMTGTMSLARFGAGDGRRPGDLHVDDVQDDVAGSYVGFANDDVRNVHLAAAFLVRASNIPGQGVKYTVDVRLARGSDGMEFAIWKFDNPEFHPMTKKMTLRKDGINESFTLTVNKGVLSGEWSSAAYGQMGFLAGSKDGATRSNLPMATKRTGAHEVCLKSFGEATLPQHAAVTMTVTPDVSIDGKVKTQASMVFFLGEYNSSERFTCALEQTELDYISGRFQGVCRSLPNTEPMMIQGLFTQAGFEGRLTASGTNGADIKPGRCQRGLR